MIMSYKTCHDATSSSPHVVVNDVCLCYYLDNEPTYQVSQAAVIIAMLQGHRVILHYIISLNIVMVRRFNACLPFIQDKYMNIS